MEEHSTQNKLTIEDIDRLHNKLNINGKPTDIDVVYEGILSDPIKYVFSRGHFRKFVLLTVCPFLILLFSFIFYFSETDISKYFKLIIVLAMIWIWFNKSASFIFTKFLMLLYAFLPFTNIYYHITGQPLSVLFVRICMGIVFLLMSAQISYQVLFR